MKYFAYLFLVMAIGFVISYPATAQESKAVQDQHKARFSSDLDKYSGCLMAFAERKASDIEKSPESIADDAHVVCENEFGVANDSALIYTASTVPAHGKLQAATYSMQKNVGIQDRNA